uniref:(northern house mosquito) hypothetical protein n=1 Tax=Culex pipiens TaxID=7175 RepID=A0A8D8CS10_CULPI
MVSHGAFRLLGYVYGLLGFFACICGAFWTGFETNEVSAKKDLTEEERMTVVVLKIAFFSVLISLVFFIFLLVGIFLVCLIILQSVNTQITNSFCSQKKVLLVKIHKVYLLINIVLSILTLASSFHGLVKGVPSAGFSVLVIFVGIG